MKKIYIIPAVEVYANQAKNSILTGSQSMGDTFDKGPGTGNFSSDVKADNDWDFWGDSEEE